MANFVFRMNTSVIVTIAKIFEFAALPSSTIFYKPLIS